jgi:ATP-dependent DNA helicase RecG
MGILYFEETPIYGANETHLDRYQIQEYFKKVYDYDIEQNDTIAYKRLLQNSGLLSEDGSATVVGLVIFGKRDTSLVPPVHYVQKFLPQAAAIYAHYAGSEITDELLDRVNFEGTAPELVEKVSEKVLLRLSTPSKIKGMKREDKIPLPRKVLREVLVNAVIHRNYSLQSKIRIFHFDNRLEVISPGPLPNSVTVEKMQTSYSIHHNPLIVKFMENMRYIDGLGRGVPMIFREMKRLGAKTPEIFADDTQVKVVIYFAPTD